jgi:hypothetical protein
VDLVAMDWTMMLSQVVILKVDGMLEMMTLNSLLTLM